MIKPKRDIKKGRCYNEGMKPPPSTILGRVVSLSGREEVKDEARLIGKET
jgi:hypothetical protein